MSEPLISICIPTYEMHGKGLEFLGLSIERIKNQNFTQFEVVVSDNSRNGDIKRYCETQVQFLNLIYVRNKRKIGISANINFAIEHARADVVKVLFQDDFFYNNDALGQLYKIWNEKDRKWLVSASVHSHDGESFYHTLVPKYHPKIFLGSNTISSPSVLMISRKDAPRFDENLTWLMDCDYYKMCFDRFGLPAVCEQPTVVNRVGAHQVSQSGVTRKIQVAELKYVMKKYALDLSLFDRVKTVKYLIPARFRNLVRKFT
jgi:glycosyltransferase involved in cell wall biosynthesis